MEGLVYSPYTLVYIMGMPHICPRLSSMWWWKYFYVEAKIMSGKICWPVIQISDYC